MADRRNRAQTRRLTPEQQQLVLDHVGLAKAIAKSTCVPITKDERVSAGYITLCSAVLTWKAEIGPFVNYLRSSIRRAVIRESNYILYGKQRGRMTKLVPRQFGFTEDFVGDHAGHLDVMIENEQYELLRSASQELTPIIKRVALFTLNGMSPAEIALKMGSHKDSVWSSLAIIRKRIKVIIAQKEHGSRCAV